MKTLIVITCILAGGEHVSPRGHYDNFRICNWYAENFQAELYPRIGDKAPLCWCARSPKPLIPLPGRKIRYDETRKAPLP